MNMLAATLQPFRFREGCHLVFVDGELQSELSDALPAGLSWQQGVLQVQAHQHILVPVHILHWATKVNVPHYHCKVILQSGSQLAITQSFLANSDTKALFTLVSDYQVADQARLQIDQLQASQVGVAEKVTAHVKKQGHFGVTQFSQGALVDQHQMHVFLDEEGADCRLLTLAAVQKGCKVEHDTLIEHLAPHTTTEQVVKSIVADTAQSVFAGMIHVHKAAQKTVAKQLNQNLLMSEKSVANARPQLRIEADDVKCSHGATVGQINPESLFYLQSRGIPKNEALPMLMLGFAEDIVAKFHNTELKQKLHASLQHNFFKEFL